MSQFSVLCLVALVVGTQAISDRIVGGKDTAPGEIKYQVMLRRVNQASGYCSGAIISEYTVLSTATCTQGSNASPANIRIAIGAHHRIQGGTLLSVSKITKHPEFERRTMRNNICVIQTTDKITLSPTVQPIKLPTAALPDKNGIELTFTGWGQYKVSDLLHS